MMKVTLPASSEPYRAKIQAAYATFDRPWVGMVNETEHSDYMTEADVFSCAWLLVLLKETEYLEFARRRSRNLTRN
jgi:hypothetical protein